MNVINTIRALGQEARDPHLDGYSQLGLKQRLQAILGAAQEECARCGLEVAGAGSAKKPKLVDVVTFFNELDLLEDRLNYLNDHVDHFIIIESNRTHSDKPKELLFEANKARFAKFLHKITLLHKIYPGQGQYSDAWGFEFEQRNFVSSVLGNFSDEDVFMVSDLDEIPNVKMLGQAKEILRTNKNAVVRMIQTLYYFDLTFRQNFMWNRLYLTNKQNILKHTATWLRLEDRVNTDLDIHVLRDGGWHLSYFMPMENIIGKMQNCAHQEFNTDFYKDPARIEKCILEGRDIYERPEVQYTIVEPAAEFPPDFLGAFKRWLLPWKLRSRQ